MSPVTVRSYRPSDHSAGRRLWSELTNEHNEMYGETTQDGGAGFEEYLTRLDLSGLWVADHADVFTYREELAASVEARQRALILALADDRTRCHVDQDRAEQRTKI